MSAEETSSLMNSHKLDRILLILEGSGPDNPGVVQRLAHIERTIYGIDSGSGIAQKVAILWRVHVWILCTLSATMGVLATEAIHLFFTKKP